MGLFLDIPLSLNADLISEADREGVSVAEHATLLLHLVTAILEGSTPTPFRMAVKKFLAERSLDPEQIAETIHELVRYCGRLNDDGGSTEASLELGQALANSPDAEVTELLRAWRNVTVHDSKRAPRVSAFGMCAHLPGGSEEYACEKQEALAREEAKFAEFSARRVRDPGLPSR